ncbi:MAG: homoserine dehydrogenase [Actinobacteria bacterium]|nr:homoserine dehydrogenase [Actinomycetota bacterium]MCL5447178.1 homoserine dehydrogenase [Actinomycetota bacterium]
MTGSHDRQGQALVRCAVLGCGNVGSALISLLVNGRDEIRKRSGIDLEIAGVAVRDTAKERPLLPDALSRELFTDDPFALVDDSSVDVVVELIGGISPAGQVIDRAIASGKSVVSANKELLATRGADLVAAAASAGVDLLYEAAVAGAIPIVRLLSESLAVEQVYRVAGIMNGTTNYVLTSMSEDGIGYEEALSRAQSLGLAESDPAADVDGHDAAAKVAILSSIAYGCDVRLDDISREGITGVRAVDVEYARQMGYVIKLLAIAESVAGSGAAPIAAPIATRPARSVAAPSVANADVIAGGNTWDVTVAGNAIMDTGAAVASAGGAARGQVLGNQLGNQFANIPEISVRVYPAMVPVSHPLASVRGSYNAVYVEGMSCGQIMLYGQGAGGVPTASAVLGDLVDAATRRLAGHRPYGSSIPVRKAAPRARISPPDRLRCAWYLNMDVTDRPGVLASVARVFGDNDISIRSMEQVGMGDEARLVFVTHEALEGNVQRTLTELRQLDAVEDIGGILRVFGA